MKILCGESEDKLQRKMFEIPKENLIELLKTDNGLHEVIDMFDPSILLRIYFDIEGYNVDSKKVLDESLDVLNNYFKTNSDCWAIAECNREEKTSYHILSKKYKMSLTNLRLLANDLHKKLPYIDTSAYWFSMGYGSDEGSLRLPNQSKKSINKEGPPLIILQGELEDFFVCSFDNLELYVYTREWQQ
jgi:hypothetical protein